MPIDRPMPREWGLLAVLALVPARQNAAKLPARAA